MVFALIRSTMSNPKAAAVSFELINHVVSDGPDQSVTMDNFGGLIAVLDDFATSASKSEIPVAPPSIKLFGSKKLSNPNPAERIPNDNKKISFPVRMVKMLFCKKDFDGDKVLFFFTEIYFIENNPKSR